MGKRAAVGFAVHPVLTREEERDNRGMAVRSGFAIQREDGEYWQWAAAGDQYGGHSVAAGQASLSRFVPLDPGRASETHRRTSLAVAGWSCTWLRP